MQQQIAPIIWGQERVHLLLRRDLDQRLRVGQKGAVATDGTGQEDAPVLGHAIGDQRGVQRLLWVVHPHELPAQVAHRQRVVVLHAEGPGVVQGPVAYHGHHGDTQTRGHSQRLESVHPAHAAAAAEHARPHRRGVFHDLKL